MHYRGLGESAKFHLTDTSLTDLRNQGKNFSGRSHTTQFLYFLTDPIHSASDML